MTRRTLPTLALVAAALSLGGCGWILGKSPPQQAENWFARQPNQAEFGRAQIADGRKALDRGDDIAAIIAFSKAQKIPQFAAEAHNGMGVGYARLGRADLADRYFRMAILEAPDEPRFRNNLAMLAQSTPSTGQGKTASAAKLASNAEPAAPPRPRNTSIPGVQVERPTSRMMRSPSGEIVINAPAPAADKQDTRLARTSDR